MMSRFWCLSEKFNDNCKDLAINEIAFRYWPTLTEIRNRQKPQDKLQNNKNREWLLLLISDIQMSGGGSNISNKGWTKFFWGISLYVLSDSWGSGDGDVYPLFRQ